MKSITFESAFSKYVADEIIGEGGSGIVYQAADDSGKICAIKLLHPSKATSEKRKRFKNEIIFSERNQHPNIISIIDHGIYKTAKETSLFYVMPLYKKSLRKFMDKHIDPGNVLLCFGQILDGVEAAHFTGVIHRDLKPENILYDEATDKFLVADFGIAHFGEEELYTLVETRPHIRLANFQYAAPEQRTRGLKVDQRADIFALGLILNEMFTKELPHGTGFKTIDSVAPEFGYLDELVSEMLRQSSDERPNSIEVIKQQLIGRKNDFITRQRISKLKQTVVPVTDIDDPLVADPPHLAGVDWDKGKLTLILHRPINPIWQWAFNNMSGYSFFFGARPENFSISGNKATINARSSDVQRIVDLFKSWLPIAARTYEEKIRNDKFRKEEEERQRLKREIEEEEERLRVLKSIKI
jgi:serine/threonine protein kinase